MSLNKTRALWFLGGVATTFFAIFSAAEIKTTTVINYEFKEYPSKISKDVDDCGGGPWNESKRTQ
jgi:hypothetical protein